MNPKLILNWEEYFTHCDALITQLKDCNYSAILAVARGGLIPAQYLAYKLNIKKIFNIGIISYSDDNKMLNNEDINLYQRPNVYSDICSDKLLIVDDIADSGRTLKIVSELYPNSDVCVLFYKEKKSIIVPGYYSQTIDNDIWVEFPYDK
jgi:xanthine phosphoribosyltransferase